MVVSYSVEDLTILLWAKEKYARSVSATVPVRSSDTATKGRSDTPRFGIKEQTRGFSAAQHNSLAQLKNLESHAAAAKKGDIVEMLL